MAQIPPIPVMFRWPGHIVKEKALLGLACLYPMLSRWRAPAVGLS